MKNFGLLVLAGLVVFAAHAQQAGNLGTHNEPPAAKTPARPNPEKTDVLRQLSGSFETISQNSGRAVVQIFVRSYVPSENPQTGELLTAQNSSGSGIIMSADGYILTNAHVVKGARTVKVQLNVRMKTEAREQGDRAMKRPLTGTVVGFDRDTDLAVVKVDRTNLPFLPFGNSDDLRQGQLVLAMGNPLGLDNSVSMGVVSAVARQIKTDDPMVYIQTDAPINPGNSGGPLVDTEGRVVGINTLIISQSGGSEGIGFAIPSNIAHDVYQQIKTQGHVHRAQIGIVGQTVTPEMADGLGLELDHGVIVSDVAPDGPAAHGGLQVDDIIIALNGKRMDSMRQLESNVFRQTSGKKITFRVQRGEQAIDLPVVPEDQSSGQLDALADQVDPQKNIIPQLGIVGLNIDPSVLKLMPELRRPAGVVVVARQSNVSYTGPLLETGDVIYSLNRHVLSNVDDLRQALTELKPGSAVVLQLERSGHIIYLPLSLD